jgi:signal transduction histidine kinase
MMAFGVAMVILMFVVAIEGLVDGNPLMIALPLMAAVAAGALTAVAQQGHLARAEWATIMVASAITTGVVLVQGAGSPRTTVAQCIIVFVALATRPWMALAEALFALVLVAAAAYAETSGLPIPLAPSHLPPWTAVLPLVVISTALVVVFTRGFDRLHGALRRHSADLEAAHAELLAAQNRLEQLVAQRTDEISRANADLEAFASSVSHDLRAPLRHVRQFLEMFALEAAELGQERLAPISEVCAAAAVLSAKTEEMLANPRRSA